jgi:hypothetical protein
VSAIDAGTYSERCGAEKKQELKRGGLKWAAIAACWLMATKDAPVS